MSEKIWVAVDCRRHRNKETGTQLTVIYFATNITGLKYIQVDEDTFKIQDFLLALTFRSARKSVRDRMYIMGDM